MATDKSNTLTPRYKHWINDFEREAGLPFVRLDEYLSGSIEWQELWEFNTQRVVIENLKCPCKFIELANRPRGTTIGQLNSYGCQFTLVDSAKTESGFSVRHYICNGCAHSWTEQEVAAMQYWSHHMYPD